MRNSGGGTGIDPNSRKDGPAVCPFCGSKDVRIQSPVGRAQLVRQYYCNTCRSVFERVRW
ncbi:hypothetical protein [Alicyclobacillus herbarius]|uniref:PaaD-like zinc ribbon domain-containing protein n=1 Tax=Alicyclobacillus herbarius TaxID=122960 RepID=UPI000423694D|nr:hypothetical protein [Alicyclobacillus herbarius]